MKNILKKSWLVVVGCMMVTSLFASTDFSTLNYNGENSIPSGYTLSTTNPPSLGSAKSGLSEGGYYINLSNGGAASLTDNIPTKRFMSFVIDENCSVNIHFYSGSTNRELHICLDDKKGSVASAKVTTKEVDHELSYTFSNITKATTVYFYGQSSSNLFLTKITFTASTPAVPVSGISLNKTSLTLEQGNEETLTATITPSDATNKGVTWSSNDENVASVVNGKVTALAVGTATITATADGDNTKTATCTVNVTENTHPTAVEGITLSKTTLSLKVGATETLTYTITPQNATNKNVSWSSSAAGFASVDNTGKVTANAEGTATITVKTADGNKTATCAVTVTAANPVPPTDLTIHEPEVYEEKKGYNTPLVTFGDREYEVYYMTRDADSKFCIATTSADKTAGITTLSSDYACTATDGWFKFSGTGWSSASDAMGDEFGTMSRRLDMDNTCEFTMHLSGFDQFAIVAKDKKKDDSSGQTKPENNRYLEVYIDDVLQAQQFNTSPSIRRYDITPKEHVIRVVHTGSEKSSMYAFSLRVSQTPRVSHHKGNDSTQTILCGKAMQDVVYRVKYNEDTRLEWVGNAPTGVTLEKRGTAGVTDTLAVVGTPIGAAGVYTYRVVAYQNGAEVSAKTGKFTIQTKLIALTDTIVEGYVGEDIDEVQFQYYAPAESDVTVQWTSSTPAGIQTATAKNIFTISGVPTAAGNFPFAVSVAGGNSIKGELIITGSEIEANTILYLYKNKDTYNKGNIYKALKAAGYKLTERKIKTTGQRADEQYKKFIMVVISEDADATAQEALDICSRTDFPTPVLNLKSFTYSTSRLGWGFPNNGVFSNAAITVQQPSHPIFKGLNATQGGSIDILTINTAEELRKGIMPAEINNCSGSYCLAIAPKDSKEYGALGDLAVAIHEIPASLHGSKYILLPLGSECVLSSAGNTLLKNIVSYLTDASSDSGIQLPDLRISRFEVNGKQALIDEDASTISLSLEPGTDLTAIKPVITLAGTATVVMPDNKEAQNFAEHARDGITYVVTDYVNRHAYQVYITAEGTGLNDNTAEGIYFDGTTLHNPNGIALYVLDMMGRIMTYSNSNVDMSDFGHGMYLITTGSNSMKVVK